MVQVYEMYWPILGLISPLLSTLNSHNVFRPSVPKIVCSFVRMYVPPSQSLFVRMYIPPSQSSFVRMYVPKTNW